MSSAESSAQKSTANGPFIKHLTKARVISVCSPAATAQPLAGKSRFNSLPPSLSSPEETNQPHKNPRHETSSSSSSSSTSLSSAPSAAAFVIANNEDLLTQILLYLPPKSLLRFQCVSKGWLSIISSPSFRSLHSRVYPTTTSSSAATKGLFLFRRRTWTDIPDLNFISFSDDYVNSMGNIVCHLSNYGKFTDIHSCNGLLALAFMLDDYAREFVVCNPTTRQHRLVPRLDFQEGGREFLALNIVFDPLKSEHYKLVCAWCEQEMITNNFGQLVPSDFHGFSVYASEKGSWRDSEDILEMEDLYFPNYFRNGVLWNGNFHWVSDFEYSLCFDPDKEFFNLTMPLARRYFWSFGESGGCLYGIEINDPEAMLFDIFEMARDYSQWVLKCHVDLTPVTTLYPSMIDADCNPATDFRCNFHILYFLEDEKENRMRLLISLCGKIILYDINDKIVKELAEVVPKDTDGDWWDSCFRWRDTKILVCAFHHLDPKVLEGKKAWDIVHDIDARVAFFSIAIFIHLIINFLDEFIIINTRLMQDLPPTIIRKKKLIPPQEQDIAILEDFKNANKFIRWVNEMHRLLLYDKFFSPELLDSIFFHHPNDNFIIRIVVVQS